MVGVPDTQIGTMKSTSWESNPGLHQPPPPGDEGQMLENPVSWLAPSKKGGSVILSYL